MKSNQDLSSIFAIILSIIVLFTFLVAYSHQSTIDVSTFEHCIHSTSCLYDLIETTQNTTLCNTAQNSSSCYLYFAFKHTNPNYCLNTETQFSCIISLSVTKNISYCELLPQLQHTECHFNLKYYFNSTTYQNFSSKN